MTKGKTFTVLGTIIALIVLGVGVYGTFKIENFWNINFAQVITLLVAILIAFMATQAKNDERKIKERMEKLFDTIIQLVSEPSFYSISSDSDPSETKKTIMLVNRRISNCISTLKETAESVGVAEQIKYIDSEFSQYNEFVSEHINDMPYLAKSENDLRKYANNIASKCDCAVIALYK